MPGAVSVAATLLDRLRPTPTDDLRQMPTHRIWSSVLVYSALASIFGVWAAVVAPTPSDTAAATVVAGLACLMTLPGAVELLARRAA